MLPHNFDYVLRVSNLLTEIIDLGRRIVIIAIFDDDIRSAQKSEEIIRDVATRTNVEDYEIFTFNNAELFRKWILQTKVDVAVLDISIESDESYGITNAKQIRRGNKNAHIIFLTSNDGMITRIFEDMIRPTQFLLKNMGDNALFSVMKNIFSEAASTGVLRISHGRTEYFIFIDEIISVSKIGRKTSVNLMDRIVETTDSLASIKNKLGDNFIWTDKGTMVNVNMIKEISFPEKRIVTKDENYIYMSRNSAKELRKHFQNVR